jgi:adenosylcobinamide kinase/adenosylcobinamide-phosphate guanylyltransferase
MTAMKAISVARSELILGGQKSGKSRRAEALAQSWLVESAEHKAVLIATAQPWDDEMRQRIGRHQADRLLRVPGMATVEEPLHLAQAIARHSAAKTLIVVDCLTLWLTNCLMPADAAQTGLNAVPTAAAGDLCQAEKFMKNQAVAHVEHRDVAILLDAVAHAPGPVVLVGNEIGLGVIPMGAEVRAFVDALGVLNQAVAQVCQRVTLMAAGLPLILKDAA